MKQMSAKLKGGWGVVVILAYLCLSAVPHVQAEPITPEQLKEIELQYSYLKVQRRGRATGTHPGALSSLASATEVEELAVRADTGKLARFLGRLEVEGVTTYEQAAEKVMDLLYDDLGFERGTTELLVQSSGEGEFRYQRYYKGYPTEFGANFILDFAPDFSLISVINRYLPITGDKTVDFTMTFEEVKAKVFEVMCGVDVCNDSNTKFKGNPIIYQHRDGTIDEMWVTRLEKNVEPKGVWTVYVDDGSRSIYYITMPFPWYVIRK
jgi:hypothetical protein